MTYATVTYDRENATPELVAALSEMVRLAIEQTSKPVLPTVNEPHQEAESTKQDSADYGADND